MDFSDAPTFVTGNEDEPFLGFDFDISADCWLRTHPVLGPSRLGSLESESLRLYEKWSAADAVQFMDEL